MAGLVVAAACTGSATPTADDAAAAPTPPPSAPNVIVIMTDDQTAQSTFVMQNLQSLIADEGTTFANSVVSYSACCPSRATFLTGQYSWNHGVRSNSPPDGGFSSFRDQDTTLPAALEAVGYTTIHIGKYLNGYGSEGASTAPAGWTRWYGLLDPSTYRYFNYIALEDGRTVQYGEAEEDYQTDVLTDLAVSAIEDEADAARPFFLNLAYLAPHAEAGEVPEGQAPGDPRPPVPARRHVGAFADEDFTAPSFDEADVDDKPGFVRGLRRLTSDDVEDIAARYRAELESLLAVDEGIAEIVDALERTGQLDETVIIFTSDNGFFHGEHRIRWGKYYPYEPSIRVPLIVRGPDVGRGEVVEQLVANIDLAPTVLELAGAPPLRPPDGESFVPFLSGGRPPTDRAIVLEGRGSGGPGQPRFVGLRTTTHVYVEYDDGTRELYDLVEDPDQLENLAGAPEAVAVQQALAARLALLAGCASTTCRG